MCQITSNSSEILSLHSIPFFLSNPPSPNSHNPSPCKQHIFSSMMYEVTWRSLACTREVAFILASESDWWYLSPFWFCVLWRVNIFDKWGFASCFWAQTHRWSLPRVHPAMQDEVCVCLSVLLLCDTPAMRPCFRNSSCFRTCKDRD